MRLVLDVGDLTPVQAMRILSRLQSLGDFRSIARREKFGAAFLTTVFSEAI